MGAAPRRSFARSIAAETCLPSGTKQWIGRSRFIILMYLWYLELGGFYFRYPLHTLSTDTHYGHSLQLLTTDTHYSC